MAVGDMIRRLWSGGSFPEENEYDDVQKKPVPKVEELMRAGRFDAATEHLPSRGQHSVAHMWELEAMTVGDIAHNLQELNPLPVKYAGDAGYTHVCEMDTKLWDLEWRPSYGRLFIDRTTIQWRLATGTNSERQQTGVPGASEVYDLTADQEDGDAVPPHNDDEIAYVTDEKLQPLRQAQGNEPASSSNRTSLGSTVVATAAHVTGSRATSAAIALVEPVVDSASTMATTATSATNSGETDSKEMNSGETISGQMNSGETNPGETNSGNQLGETQADPGQERMSGSKTMPAVGDKVHVWYSSVQHGDQIAQAEVLELRLNAFLVQYTTVDNCQVVKMLAFPTPTAECPLKWEHGGASSPELDGDNHNGAKASMQSNADCGQQPADGQEDSVSRFPEPDKLMESGQNAHGTAADDELKRPESRNDEQVESNGDDDSHMETGTIGEATAVHRCLFSGSCGLDKPVRVRETVARHGSFQKRFERSPKVSATKHLLYQPCVQQFFDMEHHFCKRGNVVLGAPHPIGNNRENLVYAFVSVADV